MRLHHVIAAKIAVTAVAWCGPLLFGMRGLFEAIGVPFPTPAVFAHLLGVAYGALLVVYGFGYRAARAGRDASAAVWTGIVSNASASLVLWLFGATGEWASWPPVAQMYMWGSAVATLAIAAGLAVTGGSQFDSRVRVR